MIKSQVVAEISHKTGMSKTDVKMTLELFFQTIQNAMAEGEAVHFRGFGSFTNKRKAQKVARDIQQNKAIVIDAHYIPSFVPAISFSKRIKKSIKA